MMRHHCPWLGVRLALALLLLCNLSGCGDGDGPHQAETGGVEPAAPPVSAPRVGEPVAAGFVDGLLTLQMGPDPLQQEGIVAAKANTFLLVVTVAVDSGPQIFAPADYRVRVDEETYTPLGVAFGGRNDVFFSVDEFLASQIDLTHDASGAVALSDERLKAVKLPKPELVLLYKVQGSDSVQVVHGIESTRLPVEDATDKFFAGLDNLQPAGGDAAAGADESVSVDVVDGRLVAGSLGGERTEVYDVTLRVDCPEGGYVLDARDLYLDGGTERTRQFYFELDEQTMRLTAGTSYTKTTFDDVPVVRIDAGGVQLGPDGQQVSLRCLFPDPPFGKGLTLRIADLPAHELISARAALGSIRPAVAEGPVRIPRAPIIGEPVEVAFLEGELPRLADARRNRTEPVAPSAEHRFLALKFQLAEGDPQLILNEYELETASGDRIRPKFLAAGLAPAEPVPEDPYEPRAIERGETDTIRRRGGEFAAWVVSEPEFLLVFEVPIGESQFTFKHGSTYLTLQPSEVARAWSAFRPDEAVNTREGVSRLP